MILITGSVPTHNAKRGEHMTTTVTDEQIRELVETAKPYSLAVLRWGPQRTWTAPKQPNWNTNDEWCHSALKG